MPWIRFLEIQSNGFADTSGPAVTTCDECGKEIRGEGYFNACANALREHYSIEHHINVPLLPP